MRRDQLEHVLRSTARITDEHEVLVIGSQSVLGTLTEDGLPPEATASIEVDVAFLSDEDGAKADLVDGMIGELSPFHETFGYYAQGVSVTTAVLPEGWRDRVVTVESEATRPGRGLCLEIHDCVVSKLVACRPKDFAFADALVREGLADLEVIEARLTSTRMHPLVRDRLRGWLEHHRSGRPR